MASRVARGAARHQLRDPDGPGEGRLLLEDGQRPAPAGEFAGDGGVGYDRSLAAGVEARPAGVQSAVGPLAAVPRARRGLVLPAEQLRAGPVGAGRSQGDHQDRQRQHARQIYTENRLLKVAYAAERSKRWAKIVAGVRNELTHLSSKRKQFQEPDLYMLSESVYAVLRLSMLLLDVVPIK